MRAHNEKKVVMILTIIVICSILLGVVGYLIESKTGFLKSRDEQTQGNGNFNINTTKDFNKGNIKTINVDTVSTDINIITTKEDDIKVHFYGNSNSRKSPPYLVTKANGDNLDVLIKYPFNIFSININTKVILDIYIPEKYKNNLEIKTVSADTIIDNFKLDKFKLTTISGEVKINSLTANETKFKSTSGELNINTLISKKNEFKAISGDTTIENITGEILGDSVSGSFKLEYSDFRNSINVKTISGDMELTIPKKSEFKLDFESVSGGLKNDFPVTLLDNSGKHQIKGNVGNGTKLIKIKTISGDSSVNALGE